MFTTDRGREFIIKDTHRGLLYEDGKLAKVLEAGRYTIPPRSRWQRSRPIVECLLVDVRERELTIKGQEILTSDKVAIRVSVLVQFRVTDPKAAIHTVDNFENRIYSDVQLAARRSLASMALDEILTNRNRLSEDILSDVKEAANDYGVAIRRADVKDLIFPGNLQEIMNRVLAAERNSQAQLVEARTRAEVEMLQAESRAENTRREAEAEAEASLVRQQAEASALQRTLKPKPVRTASGPKWQRCCKSTLPCCVWQNWKRFAPWHAMPTHDSTSASIETDLDSTIRTTSKKAPNLDSCQRTGTRCAVHIWFPAHRVARNTWKERRYIQ